MIDEDYTGDSGKFENVIHTLENVLSRGHKVLVFSQFVRHLDIYRKYFDAAKTPYDYLDGATAKRGEVVKAIREIRPQRMVIQSPERNWDRIGASHPDHLAAGEAAIQAVYPDARNPFAFTDLLDNEGLQPHRVKEVWMMGFANPDHWVDITDTFDLKMKALNAHASQTAHNKELENMVREWGHRNAGMGGLPEGRIAEAFKIINTN